MKHDIELVRAILLQLREKSVLTPAPVFIEGYEPVLVARHVEQLLNAGFIEGRVSAGYIGGHGNSAPLILATDLSLDGHNFLGSLENKQVWSKLKEALSPQELATFPLKKIAEISVELAMQWARKKLGLDD